MAVNGAGPLRERVRFEARKMGDDGFGKVLSGGEFELRFTVWANYRALVGSEAVQGARLQGRQPYIIRVRQSSQTREATPSWRLVDVRNPSRVFAITAPPTDPDGSRTWLEFLVTEGAPA